MSSTLKSSNFLKPDVIIAACGNITFIKLANDQQLVDENWGVGQINGHSVKSLMKWKKPTSLSWNESNQVCTYVRPLPFLIVWMWFNSCGLKLVMGVV